MRISRYSQPSFAGALDGSSITGNVNPVTIGHEFAGVVSAVGPDVKNFKVGDHVVPRPLVTCGKCASCKAGHWNTCDHLNFIGYSSDNGGFAEYANFREDFVHHLPEDMPFEQGALMSHSPSVITAWASATLRPGRTRSSLAPVPSASASWPRCAPREPVR